jgi:putative ABC transport system permease protein
MMGLAAKLPDEIWVLNTNTQSSLQLQGLDARAAQEVASIPGVRRISPILITSGSARFANGTRFAMSVVGLSAPAYLGQPKVAGGLNALALASSEAVIVDMSDFGMMGQPKVGSSFLVNDKRVVIGGFSIGNAGFGASNLVTTIERARYLSGGSSNSVSAVLLEVDSSLNTSARVIAAINQRIPHVRAVTGAQLGDMTMDFMTKNSNIAVSFQIMVIIALISGICVVGLMMFSSVNDRIRDYGTIKAIGGTSGMIARLILQQGLIHTILGYALSIGVLWSISLAMRGGRMEMNLTWDLMRLLFLLTLLISAVGCLLGLRKILRLEPAAIYRM